MKCSYQSETMYGTRCNNHLVNSVYCFASKESPCSNITPILSKAKPVDDSKSEITKLLIEVRDELTTLHYEIKSLKKELLTVSDVESEDMKPIETTSNADGTVTHKFDNETWSKIKNEADVSEDDVKSNLANDEFFNRKYEEAHDEISKKVIKPNASQNGVLTQEGK